jgi:hypothetical protein
MKCTYWSDPGFWPGTAETHRIGPRCRTRLSIDLLSSWLRRTAALARWLIASDILLLPWTRSRISIKGEIASLLTDDKYLVAVPGKRTISVGVGIDEMA